MDILRERKLIEPLREYVLDGTKPFMGVCLGLQLLFDGSEESGGVEGLGLIPGTVTKFTGDDFNRAAHWMERKRSQKRIVLDRFTKR